MRLIIRSARGVAILEPHGKITIGEGEVKLREAIDELVELGRLKILLNLASTTRMDSSGMAELVAAFNRVREAGGSLGLFGLTPKIRNVLGVTQLVTVFDVFDDEREAVSVYAI